MSDSSRAIKVMEFMVKTWLKKNKGYTDETLKEPDAIELTRVIVFDILKNGKSVLANYL